ncbi:hypothetical protein N7492_006494 [Penicillium capsulatum]|uniref:Uncharacterized protein n=1 Tax=Penicillium capsulatum TaxID=69766 RepID=A0A9W9LJT8_9EURO|nr:hypothetical protein N7492_006494 [Penicillium capsulatum]
MATSFSNGGGWGMNDSCPPMTTNDCCSRQFTKSGTMDVFYPYDIEEPEDELCSSIGRELPRLPDHFEKWQRDLVDDMDHLESNSMGRSGVLSPISGARGQKRKSSSPESSPNQDTFDTQTKPKMKRNSTPRCGSHLGPKRRRRRSRIADAATKTVHATSIHEFREAERGDSSSSDPCSPEGSSPDSNIDSAMTDEMEVD